MADTLLQDGWRETTRKIGGLDLHVVEAGEPGAPLLVLLHGFPEFWWAWRHQITPFAEAGYHVVVPDMRGYNLSDAPQEVASYRLDTLAADVTLLADAFGADRFHLVGHDWGAVIGWWVAAKYPARLQSVVLMDGPHPDVWGKQALRHPTQALRSTYVAFFQLPWVPEATLGSFDYAGLRAMMQGSAKPDTFEPGALDHYAEAWRQPGSLTAMLNYYRALRERPHESEPARLAPPTLILWAGDDLFLERNVAEAGLALCDDGRLEIVGGASHWLHLEQPERINARILTWLKAASDRAALRDQRPSPASPSASAGTVSAATGASPEEYPSLGRHERSRKPFGPAAHGAIDYAFVASLLLAPTLLNLKGPARTLCYAFGASAGILNALTDQPFALKRKIPFRVHGQVDTPFVPILLLLPWATGALKPPNARRFFTSFFLAVLSNYLLTDYQADDSAEAPHAG